MLTVSNHCNTPAIPSEIKEITGPTIIKTVIPTKKISTNGVKICLNVTGIHFLIQGSIFAAIQAAKIIGKIE